MNITPLKVAIAENDLLVREGIKCLLANEADLAFVGTTAVGDDLFRLLDDTRPDVLIISGHLPQHDQLPVELFGVAAALKQMAETHPETAVILIARHYVPLVGEALTLEQVRGFLLRRDDLALELPVAVRTVHEGGTFLSETAKQELLHPITRGEEYGLDELQVAILTLLITMPNGKRSSHARCLGASENVFRHQLQRLFDSLGVKSRLAIILRSIRLGILRLEDL